MVIEVYVIIVYCMDYFGYLDGFVWEGDWGVYWNVLECIMGDINIVCLIF